MIRKPINITALTIAFLVIGLLSVVSFFGAWAYDEGTISNSILATLFKVFRFPAHTLFGSFFNRTATTFYSGLLLNIVFYAFLTERIFSFTKRKKQMAKFFILAFLFVTLYSCETTQQKFDMEKWVEGADLMTFPNRKSMVDDLIKNIALKGKTYQYVVSLLGQSQSSLDSTMEIGYKIDEDYGNDIDPIYTQILLLYFDKD